MVELNKVYNEDCIDELKKLDSNSIDSIVTDPPYELGFMNKKWDSTGIAYNVDLWKECLRVLKPGGYLLSFGGTRTYHRMACAIEDAGFQIRDMIQWIYGSGFPKSYNISKGIDKKFGAERKVISTKDTKSGGFAHVMKTNKDQGYRPNDYYQSKGNHIQVTAPATDEVKQWDGWGTALKPANEPICMARKPLSEKTVVANVLKWGTGGINIDDSRVKYGNNESANDLSRSSQGFTSKNEIYHNDDKYKTSSISGNTQGRFPANVILDEEAGNLLDKQSGIKQTTRHMSYKRTGEDFIDGIPNQEEKDWFAQEKGGASRFFYCAKASKKEKGKFNNHPTVKPIKLMRYLVRLVTPKDGIVLDPFAGSGSTLIAAKNEGFNYIGIEKNEHYCEIAEKRIK